MGCCAMAIAAIMITPIFRPRTWRSRDGVVNSKSIPQDFAPNASRAQDMLAKAATDASLAALHSSA